MVTTSRTYSMIRVNTVDSPELDQIGVVAHVAAGGPQVDDRGS